jgi:RNA polymerase sigma-70 factor (sigma-E family)
MDDEGEFREFVASRSAALQRTAWLLVGDWATAQDLVQTALAKTWPRWHQIRNSDQPDLYVRRVMVNTYATWWRRRWRGEIPTGEPPERATHSDAFDEIDARHAVQQALAVLPRRQRAVVVLRYWGDLTEVQTADVLGCSVGTVKSQASRALATLRGSTQLAGLISEGVVS